MANEIRFRNNGNDFKIIQSIDNEYSLYTGVKGNNGNIFVKLNENIKEANSSTNGNIKKFFNLENILPKNGVVSTPSYQMIEPAEFAPSGELIKKGVIKFGQVNHGTIDLSQRLLNVSNAINNNVMPQNVIGAGNIFDRANNNLMQSVRAQMNGLSVTEDLLLDKLSKHSGRSDKVATYLIELDEYMDNSKANGNPITLSDRAKNAIKQSGYKGVIERQGSDGNVHKYIIMDDGSQYRMKTPVSQTQQPVVQPVQPNVSKNIQPSVQSSRQQTNANAEKLKAWRDTPKYSGVTSAKAKPSKPISIRSVPASNVAASMAVGETIGNVAKPSMLNKLGNAAKSGVAKKLGTAAAVSAVTNILPGSDDTIPIPWLESTAKGLETAGEWAGGLSLASLGASIIPGVQPVTLPVSTISGITSAGASGLANILRSMYGEKPVKQFKPTKGNAVNTNTSGSLHGNDYTTENGYSEVSSGDEMSYQDIFDNLAKNKINYETPVSPDVLNKAIKNTVFSSIGEMMGQNTSGGIRGDVTFNDTYEKQLNALLNIRDTLNNAEVGGDQYRLAGIASNAMLYGQDVLNAVDSNFNKDLARVNDIMKAYSTQMNNSADITKAEKILNDNRIEQAAAIQKVEDDIAKEIKSAREKGTMPPSDQEIQNRRLEAGRSFDKPIADMELKIKELVARGNTQRRVGSSTTMTAKGRAIVDMWNSLPNKDVDITDDHINIIAHKAGLNDVQKKAVESTILAETGNGRSDSLNSADGKSASIGMIQWNDDYGRATKLIKTAREQGANPKSALFQANYLASDIKNPSSWTGGAAKMNAFFNSKTQAEANKHLTEGYINNADHAGRLKVLEHYQTKL